MPSQVLSSTHLARSSSLGYTLLVLSALVFLFGLRSTGKTPPVDALRWPGIRRGHSDHAFFPTCCTLPPGRSLTSNSYPTLPISTPLTRSRKRRRPVLVRKRWRRRPAEPSSSGSPGRSQPLTCGDLHGSISNQSGLLCSRPSSCEEESCLRQRDRVQIPKSVASDASLP